MNRYIGGTLLMTIGIFIIVGGLTGNLGPMIAALFDPSDLATTSGSPAAEPPSAAPGSISPQGVANAANPPALQQLEPGGSNPFGTSGTFGQINTGQL